MMSDDVLSLLKKRLRDQMNELADHLAVGSAKDIEEYRRSVGSSKDSHGLNVKLWT